MTDATDRNLSTDTEAEVTASDADASEGFVQLAQSTTGYVAETPTQNVQVSRPAPGETLSLDVQSGQRYVINFDPTAAQVQIDGNDFVLVFEDGGSIVFENLVGLAQSGQAPVLQVGGVDIGGDVILGQAIALSGEQTTLETAAGDGQGQQVQGSGANVYNDNLGDIIDTLNAQPDIPYVALGFGLVDEEIIDDDFLSEPVPSETIAPLVFIPSFGIVGDQFLPPRSPEGSQFNEGVGVVVNDDPTTPTAVFQGEISASSPDVNLFQVVFDGVTYTPHVGASFQQTFFANDDFELTVEEGDILVNPDGPVAALFKADGTYFLIQKDNISHPLANVSGADDTVDFPFEVTIFNNLEQFATGTVTLTSQDDAPDVMADQLTVAAGQPPVTGNVLDNDILGADGDVNDPSDLAFVDAIIFNGVTTTLNAVGTTVIFGDAGQLEIDRKGEFTYTAFPVGTTTTSDEFTYIFIDSDGDSDSAPISVNFKPDAKNDGPGTVNDPGPIAEDSDRDGTNFDPDPDVLMGNVLDNDFPGTDGFADPTITQIAYTGAEAVTQNQVGNVVTITQDAGVWRLTIDLADGSYEFELLQRFEHADGDGRNFFDQTFEYTISDADGDMDGATLTVRIEDDIPIAVNDTAELDNKADLQVDGNVRDNDDQGADTAVVTNIESDLSGDSDPVPDLGNGSATVKGNFGDLTIFADGTFTYDVTVDPGTIPSTGISESFTYTLTDEDEDTSTATLNIRTGLDAKDDGLDADNGQDTVKEDRDGLGEGGTFVTDPAPPLTGNLLENDTFGSDPIETPPITNVTYAGNNLGGDTPGVTTVATADGFLVTLTDPDRGDIWTLSVNSTTGAYVFTLLQPFDHEMIQGMNDIVESFEYTISEEFSDTNPNPDSDTATLRIKIVDDVPVAFDDTASVDIDDTPADVEGNVRENDDLGGDTALVTNIASTDGTPESKAVSDTGDTTIEGAFGTLVIDEDGDYTYTLTDPASIPQGGFEDVFIYTLTDADGDTSTATLTIDSALVTRPDGFDTDNDPGGIKEDLVNDTFDPEPDSLSGNVLENDTLGNGPFEDPQITDVNHTAGSPDANVVKTAITIGPDSDPGFRFELQDAGGDPIWRLDINAETGDYTFDLLQRFEHEDGMGMNDFLEQFTYTVSEVQPGGDTSSSTLTIQIIDDTPVAIDDCFELEVAEATFTAVFNIDVSGSMGLAFDGTDNPGPGDSRLEAAIEGIKATLQAFVDRGSELDTKVVLQPFAGAGFPLGGDRAPLILGDLEGYDSSDPNDPINIYLDDLFASGGTEFEGPLTAASDFLNDVVNQSENNLIYHVSDGEDESGYDPATNASLEALYDNSIPNLQIFAFGLGTPGSFRVDIDQLDTVVAGENTVDGSIDPANADNVALAANGDALQDLLTNTIQPMIQANVLDNDDQGGDTATVTGIGVGAGVDPSTDVDQTLGTTIDGLFGTLEIMANGDIKYTVTANPADLPSGGVTEFFTYEITDLDGDISTATFKFDLSPELRTRDDGLDTDNGQAVITEDLVAGTFDPDPNELIGNLRANDTDGDDPLTDPPITDLQYLGPNAGDVNSVAVDDTFTGGNPGFAFELVQDGVTIWRLDVDATDGDYRFQLLAPFDHETGMGINDLIETFQYTVSELLTAENPDPDSSSSFLRIKVVDDVPIAENDSDSLAADETQTTGNVRDNDDQGGDLATVTAVDGETVPAGGANALIGGAFGDLLINEDGTYTYTVTADPATIPQGGVSESFEYTLTDDDGDTSQATLTIGSDLNTRDDGLDTDNGQAIIEEDLVAGSFDPDPDFLTGNVLANDTLGDDPLSVPPIVEVNHTGGSDTSDVVKVAIAGGFRFTFVDDGESIWQLDINTTTGEYRFDLLAGFDHGLGGTEFIEEFTYTVSELDPAGDSDSSTLRIKIVDDVPVALDDSASLTNDQTVVDGNVRDNDDQGGDLATVTAVEGTDVPDNGTTATIAGDFGDLVIDENGDYTYTVTADPANIPDTGVTEAFEYTLTDEDGDTSMATLTIGTDLITRNDGFGTDNDPGGIAEDLVGGTFDPDPDELTGNVLDNDTLGSEPLADPPISNFQYTGTNAGVSAVPVDGGFTGNPGFAFQLVQDGDLVWRIDLDAVTGDYRFQLLGQFDHETGMGVNDFLEQFTYTVQQQDGDTDSSNLTIQIIDDVPFAVNDSETLTDDQTEVQGNVRDNDDQGGDLATVTAVDGVDVPTNGTNATIFGTFGNLVIDETGNYTYTVTADPADIPATGVAENFQYTLTDTDGDTSQATLTLDTDLITRNDGFDTDNDPGGIKEDLVGGTFDPDPDFLSGNVLTNDTLGNEPLANPPIVNVEHTGGSTGVVEVPFGDDFAFELQDAGGDPIWRLEIDSTTGDYQFNLLQRFEHEEIQGMNDFLEQFTYTVEQADGDQSSANLTLQIVDDVPVANDDCFELVVPDPTFSLVLNLDVSGSMGWAFNGDRNPGPGDSRLEQAIEGVKATLQAYVDLGHEDVTQIRFQPFNDGFPLSGVRGPADFSNLDGYSASDNSHPINAYLNGLFAEGSTQYEDVMDAAATFLDQATNQAQFNLLYFVSDGADNNGYDVNGGDPRDGLYDNSIPNLEILAFGLGIAGSDDVNFDQLDIVVAGENTVNGGVDPANADNIALAENGQDLADLFLSTLPGPEIMGNILDNDDQGGDTATVTMVDGEMVGANGITQIQGDFGVLEIDAQGNFTYKATANLPPQGATETFDYKITDLDGDISEAQFKIDLIREVLVVGSNEDDNPQAPTDDPAFDHRIPNGPGGDDGPIDGANGDDVLVGDVGGVNIDFIPAENLNIAITIDTSGSMTSDAGVSGADSRAELTQQSIANLVSDLAAFTDKEGSTINLYLQPFATFASFGDDDNRAVEIQFDGSTITFDVGGPDQEVFQYNANDFDDFDGDPDDNPIFDYIDNLDFEGFTNYQDGILKTRDWLEDQVDETDGFRNVMFFLSDGLPNTTGNSSNFQTNVGQQTALNAALAVAAPLLNGTGVFVGEDAVAVSAIGIGNGVTTSTLDQVDNTNGGADIVTNPSQFQEAIQGGFEEIGDLLSVGSDVLNGFAGNDVIWGDVPNTDALGVQLGLADDLPAGSGFEIFQKLLDDGTLDVADVKNILANPNNFANFNAGDRGEADTIDGGEGDDTIFGQGGADVLIGGLGNDLIDAGNDTESDQVLFDVTVNEGIDTVTNFKSDDILKFGNLVDQDNDNDVDIDDLDAVINSISSDGSDVTIELDSGTEIVLKDVNVSAGNKASILDVLNDTQVDVS